LTQRKPKGNIEAAMNEVFSLSNVHERPKYSEDKIRKILLRNNLLLVFSMISAFTFAVFLSSSVIGIVFSWVKILPSPYDYIVISLLFVVNFPVMMFLCFDINHVRYAQIVYAADKFKDAPTIPMQEIRTTLASPYFMSWNTGMWLKEAVKKGYLPNYKYLVRERLLVRIENRGEST